MKHKVKPETGVVGVLGCVIRSLQLLFLFGSCMFPVVVTVVVVVLVFTGAGGEEGAFVRLPRALPSEGSAMAKKGRAGALLYCTR